MRKIILSLIIALLGVAYTYAQTNNRLWIGIEAGYGYSFAEKTDNYGMSYANNNSLSLIQAVIGYYIIPDLSIGVGIGINGHANPGLNTIPLLLDIRYHPLRDKNLVLNGNIGYPVATNEEYLDAKATTALSVGYTLFKIKKIKITPSIGYNYCAYSVTDIEGAKHDNKRNSLFVKVGIVY